MLEINKIHNYNCLDGLKLLEDSSVDCCVTSPSYWKLRDYRVEEQLGNEPNFRYYIDGLCAIFYEVKRVLKKEGTCFINLGDTYNGNKEGNDDAKNINTNTKSFKKEIDSNIANKCLLMIPSRVAIKMIDDGWILRNEVIWHKPNQMPSSAIDRFTVDFEKIFFFVKQRKYYFEQQIDPYTKPLDRWGGNDLDANGNSRWDDGTGQFTYRNRNMRPNPDGKNMRTVWSVNTEHFSDAHFATYPERLVERMIKAGCPANGIVLDPFMGAGTTGLVARKLGRNFIGFELNPKYIKIAEKRLYDELGMFL